MSLTTTYCCSSVMVLPTALPMVTPMRSGGTLSMSSLLSASASRAHTRANCEQRSVRSVSSAVRPSAAGSKSHSAAMRERNPAGSNRVMPRVAVVPEVSRAQNAFVPLPPGAMTPMPVIAARRRLT